MDEHRGRTVEARVRPDSSVTGDCVVEPARLWAGDHTTATPPSTPPGSGPPVRR